MASISRINLGEFFVVHTVSVTVVSASLDAREASLPHPVAALSTGRLGQDGAIPVKFPRSRSTQITHQ